MIASGIMSGGSGLLEKLGCVSSRTIASHVDSMVSSHGRGSRSVCLAKASFSPPPMPPLKETLTSAPLLSCWHNSVHSAWQLANASGSGWACAVMRIRFLSESKRMSCKALGWRCERRATALAEPVAVLAQDSTNAVMVSLGGRAQLYAYTRVLALDRRLGGST